MAAAGEQVLYTGCVCGSMTNIGQEAENGKDQEQ